MGDTDLKDQGTVSEEQSEELDVDAILQESEETKDQEEYSEEEQKEAPQKQEEKSSEDDTTYEIDGISFTKEDFKRMYDRDTNYKKWDAQHHKKGRELNQLKEQLEQEKSGIDQYKEEAEEYRAAKKVLEANPKAYEYLKQLINEGGGQVSPRIKQLEEQMETDRQNWATEQAKGQLSKKYEDFDYDSIKEFMKERDWDDRTSVLEFQYFAKLGSQFDEKLQEALAKQSENQGRNPSPPPHKGGGRKIESTDKEFESQDEMVAAALKDLELGNL